MKNCVFRPARQEDLVDIIHIWTEAFGDEPEFPRQLLQDLSLLKNALVAECDGKVVCSLLLYHGLKLDGHKAAYLYALCTHPDYGGRGIATALTSFAAEVSRSRGAELLLLQPGDEYLERWYTRRGFRVLWRSHWEGLDVKGISPPNAEAVSANEFLASLPPSLMATQELISSQSIIQSLCGGEFLRIGNCLLCAEFDGIILRIRYAHCPESELPHAAAAAARYFGAEHIFRLRRDDENTGTALMALPLSGECPMLPDELFFPFTLD